MDDSNYAGCGLSTDCSPKTGKRIVGGKSAHPCQFPWQVNPFHHIPTGKRIVGGKSAHPFQFPWQVNQCHHITTGKRILGGKSALELKRKVFVFAFRENFCFS
jgi:hypothetical protein